MPGFIHRLVIVCPLARIAALGTWYAANVDAADDCSTWPSLNASGLLTDPETHRWASTALTEPLLRAIIVKACQLASVTPPTAATWNGWTRAQKQTWLASTRNSLFTATGIWLDLSDGEGTWTDPDSILGTLGLKRRG
jgi:hypothetical protein